MVGHGTVLLTEHEIAVRYAESMKLFERGGKIAFGKFREWSRAGTKEEADTLLKKFREDNEPL